MGQSSKTPIYSSKNVVLIVILFLFLFWMLYSIASQLHKWQTFDKEVESIRDFNNELRADIEAKKQYFEYLQTPQRKEKEAKMQMGRKLPGERVIVLIEEQIDLLPTEKERLRRSQIQEQPNWKKWYWVFFGERTS